MRAISLIVLISALAPASAYTLADETPGGTPVIGEFLQSSNAAYLQKLAALYQSDDMLLASGGFNDFPAFGSDMYSAEHRSIGRAFLYSFMVPGLGEYYAGSKIKAGVFLAFEAFTWAQYATNQSSGNRKDKEFRNYADAHWDITGFVIHLIEDYGTVEDTLPGDKLPESKTQQYYEMIGKYTKFWPGWDDYDSKTGTSQRQKRYIVMRDEANKKLNTARTWAMVALANHILSAFDAALTAKRFNKQRDVFSEVNVRARLANNHDERIPQLVMTYRFF